MRTIARHLLVAISLSAAVSAKVGWGESCAQANTHLDSANYQLVTDCDATTYCADNSTCAYKGCRQDTYPYGYNDYSYSELPPMCPTGEFCPDEGDQCLTQVPVGSSCQKDRDDECAPPSNWKELSGTLNTNGSICLDYTCYYANVTLGQTCVNDNTAYTAYKDDGTAYAFIVSRDNCANGHYCDGTALQCYKDKKYGATCTGNKECSSYNCEDSGTCGKAADDVVHPPVWQYVLIGLGIVILIVAVMTALWFYHRKWRAQHQRMLEQYYNEQIAYRQSIMSMSAAKQSLLNIPRSTGYDATRTSMHGGENRYPTSGLANGANTVYGNTAAEDADQAWSSGVQYGGVGTIPNLRRDSMSGWSEQAGGSTVNVNVGGPHGSGLGYSNGESDTNLVGKYSDSPDPKYH